MKIQYHFSPKIELLSQPTYRDLELLAKAARTCYKSWKKEHTHQDDIELIRRLVNKGHESVIEHVSVSFKIYNISRACSHQLVRHRLCSFSQESQRYVKEDEPHRIAPMSIFEDEESWEIFDKGMISNALTYRDLLENHKSEVARCVLPNATATTITVTANLRQWRKFLQLRCDKHASKEIRQIAFKILAILYSKYQPVFEDIYNEYSGNVERFPRSVDIASEHIIPPGPKPYKVDYSACATIADSNCYLCYAPLKDQEYATILSRKLEVDDTISYDVFALCADCDEIVHQAHIKEDESIIERYISSHV